MKLVYKAEANPDAPGIFGRTSLYLPFARVMVIWSGLQNPNSSSVFKIGVSSKEGRLSW